MSRKIALILACLIGLTQVASAAESSIGFIQNNVWFSPSHFFAGASVRVYTAILNTGTDDVIGSVEFFDNGTSLGVAGFSAVANSLQPVWRDWMATSGSHAISAKIISAYVSKAGAPNKPITLATTQSNTFTTTVDVDTDRDGIGNTADPDDDNDGVSDATELAKGTDPLVPEVRSTAQTTGQTATASSTARGFLGAATAVSASVVDSINAFADSQVDTLEQMRDSLTADIAALKRQEAQKTITVGKGDPSNLNEISGEQIVPPEIQPAPPHLSLSRTLKTIQLWLVQGALYVLKTKWLLHILLLLLLFFVLRWVFRRFFRRSA